jgi:serine/threonine-protein kinase RsbW
MIQLFEIQSRTENLKVIREQIRPLLRAAGFGSKDEESILVALGEACTNAIRHSHLNIPDKIVKVTYEEDPLKIVLRIRDFGRKIDLTKIQKPKLPPETSGGLGIYFMQTIMDAVEYNTAFNEGNELVLTKFKPSQKTNAR